MFKVSLATYTLRIREIETGKYQKLDKLAPKKEDLLKILQDWLAVMKKENVHTHNEAAHHVFNVTKADTTGRTISGTVESGIYGRASKLRDVVDWKVTHTKTVKEADMLPFYFLFDIPEGTDEGILIVERVGNIGIRKSLGTSIGQYVETRLPGFSFGIHHLARQDVVKAYLDGGAVSAIRFVHFGLPKDFADLLEEPHVEKRGSLELVARMGRGRAFDVGKRLQEYVSGKVKLQRFVELEDFEYDTVKIDVAKGGENRTIDLNKLKMRGFYNISAVVELDASGNPEFGSIDDAARELLQEVKDGVYLPPEEI
jgi:hypothetical protein